MHENDNNHYYSYDGNNGDSDVYYFHKNHCYEYFLSYELFLSQRGVVIVENPLSLFNTLTKYLQKRLSLTYTSHTSSLNK